MIQTINQNKTMPHSEEAERAVLAGALLDPALVSTISGRLTADDFYSSANRTLFGAMVDLQAGGSEVDLRTLQAILEQQDKLEAVGGVAYLASLDLDLPDISRFDSYVEIVKERSVRRRLIDACGQITRHCLDGGLVAQEALGRAEQAILSLGEEAIQRGFVRLADIFEDTLAELEERPAQGFIGLPTGLVDFDEKTRGLNEGNLIILAGRPGMGKTSLALNIAQHVALRESKSVGIFSLEMSQQELALRILSAESDIPFGPLRSGHLSQQKWNRVIEHVREISSAPIFIDDSANPSLLEVASKARRLKVERSLDLLVVDYLQLMQAGGRYENRNLEISAITRSFKQLAKELKIPILLLSQLSRQPERRGSDHRPQLADLRESGSIEQDADLVVFIYRDEVYNSDVESEERGIAELIIAKHRNGETGTVKTIFLGDTTSFRNRARHDSSPPPF
jgi:replicative DNA helicase